MSDLEKEGCALVKQYGFVLKMNKPLTAFLRKVAEAMRWETFASML